MADSRFVPVNVDCFIQEKKNYKKKGKTDSDLRLFKQFLKDVHDIELDLEAIKPQRLDVG